MTERRSQGALWRGHWRPLAGCSITQHNACDHALGLSCTWTKRKSFESMPAAQPQTFRSQWFDMRDDCTMHQHTNQALVFQTANITVWSEWVASLTCVGRHDSSDTPPHCCDLDTGRSRCHSACPLFIHGDAHTAASQPGNATLEHQPTCTQRWIQ